jgi:hypothetical protein
MNQDDETVSIMSNLKDISWATLNFKMSKSEFIKQIRDSMLSVSVVITSIALLVVACFVNTSFTPYEYLPIMLRFPLFFVRCSGGLWILFLMLAFIGVSAMVINALFSIVLSICISYIYFTVTSLWTALTTRTTTSALRPIVAIPVAA